MTILFPSDPLRPRQPDYDFQSQAQAAQEAGLDILLLDSDALDAGEIERSLRLVRLAEEPQVLALRGWMLRLPTYTALFDALLERNWRLLCDPQSYALCHELPNWYPLLEGRTPESRWLPIPECFEAERVARCASLFGAGPLLVKDWVKSRKHEWRSACFIQDALDASEVARVTGNFLLGQAESLYGGLVLRRFVPLSRLDSQVNQDAKGAPLVNEWRLFWLDHAVMAMARHGSQSGQEPPPQVLEDLSELARRIASRFFTMDVAQAQSSEWIVIELGDGGVSGLPEQMDARAFYTSLQLGASLLLE